MKKIDKSLFGTVLFIFVPALFSLLHEYGYVPPTPKTMLLVTGSMLIGMYLWFTGMISKSDEAAEPANKSG